MSGTDGIRIVELPDLGAATDAASVVAEKSGSGRISLPAVRSYVLNGAFPEAPLDGGAYGRYNAGWAKTLPLTGGTVTGNLTVTGTETVSGLLYCQGLAINPANSYEWFLALDVSGNHIQQHRTNWWDQWASSTGMRSWNGPAGNLMTLDGAGMLSAVTFTVAGTSNQFGLGISGSNRLITLMPSFFLDFSSTGPTAGTLQYYVSDGPLWVMRASDDFCYNPKAAVGGNGAYLNISDRRAKDNIKPTTRGLSEVLQLEPVEFKRTDAATEDKNEIGFVAQDVQPIVPEAVWQAAIPLKDGTGGLGDPNPTLAISEATLTALNVNAIKELHNLILAQQARIEALEAARSTHV